MNEHADGSELPELTDEGALSSSCRFDIASLTLHRCRNPLRNLQARVRRGGTTFQGAVRGLRRSLWRATHLAAARWSGIQISHARRGEHKRRGSRTYEGELG